MTYSEDEPLASWVAATPTWMIGSLDACATSQPRLRYRLEWILLVSWAEQRGTVCKHRRLDSGWGAGAAQSVWVLNQHALCWTFSSAKASSWFNWIFFVCRRKERSSMESGEIFISGFLTSGIEPEPRGSYTSKTWWQFGRVVSYLCSNLAAQVRSPKSEIHR